MATTYNFRQCNIIINIICASISPRCPQRCSYVVDTFERRNANVSDKKALKEMYMAQSVDYNIFYRATAILFWWDFAAGTGEKSNIDR